MEFQVEDLPIKLLRIFSLQKNYRFLVTFIFLLSVYLFFADFWTNLLPQMIIINTIVGLLYFGIFPGLLGVELLFSKKPDGLAKIIHIIALSIVFDYLILFLINSSHFVMQLASPLDRHYVIPVFCLFFISAIFWLNQKSDIDFNIKSKILDLKEIPTKLSIIFLIVSLIITIIGTVVVQEWSNSGLLMVLILFFSVIPLLIAIRFLYNFYHSKKCGTEIDLSFRLWDPRNVFFYPIIIYAISLSLLWQQTLISPVFRNGDIITEVMIFKNLLNNLWWNPYFLAYSPPSGTMSTTLLPYTFSTLFNLDYVWYFKLIYPMIFAFVPVILYKIYEIGSNKTIAFFASYLFLMSPVYTVLLTQDTRQGVAELFLCILLLLLIEKYQLSSKEKLSLFCLYGFGLVASHYGAAAFLVIFFMFALLILYLFQFAHQNFNTTTGISPFLKEKVRFLSIESEFSNKSTNDQKLLWDIGNNKHFLKYFVAIIIIFFIYNIYVYLPIFSKIVYKSGMISDELFGDSSLEVNKVVSFSVKSDSGGITLMNLMTYFIILFLILGCIALLYYFVCVLLKKNTFFSIPQFYIAISVSAAFTGAFLVLLQSFSGSGIGIERSYHIITIFLSVFSIIGIFLIGFFIIKQVNKDVPLKKIYSVCLIICAVLLGINFLFQTGFVFEVADDIPLSYSLSYEKNLIIFNFENDFFIEKWLITKGDKNTNIYINRNSLQEYGRTGILPMKLHSFTTTNYPTHDSYVLVKTGFALSDEFWLTDYSVYRKNIKVVPIKNNQLFDKMDIIYNNVGKVYIAN